MDESAIKVSILIKALNEESRIAACLASVFRALAETNVEAEVIVADALSNDHTAEIARSNGARVVQLRSVEDRGCGSGVQLGYQASRGEFAMFLDADMELEPGFLTAALAAMATEARLAGVAGQLIDTAENNWFDRKRVREGRRTQDAVVPSLGGGGLFRREAIEACGGYAGNRNLHAFEEAELGLRLGSGGWYLKRLALPGVRHTGHCESSLGLIRRYWRARRMDAVGVMVRVALGKPWLRSVLGMFVRPIAVVLFWCVLLPAAVIGASWLAVALLASVALAVAVLAWKKRSLRDAGISLVLWHIVAVGLVRGLFGGPLKSATAPIGCRDLTVSERVVDSMINH